MEALTRIARAGIRVAELTAVYLGMATHPEH